MTRGMLTRAIQRAIQMDFTRNERTAHKGSRRDMRQKHQDKAQFIVKAENR